jgi:hypothetical protein
MNPPIGNRFVAATEQPFGPESCRCQTEGATCICEYTGSVLHEMVALTSKTLVDEPNSGTFLRSTTMSLRFSLDVKVSRHQFMHQHCCLDAPFFRTHLVTYHLA